MAAVPEWAARIVTRHLAERYLFDGWTIEEIARSVDCSSAHLLRVMVEVGIPRRKPGERLARSGPVPAEQIAWPDGATAAAVPPGWTWTNSIAEVPDWAARIATRHLVDRYLVDGWTIKEIAGSVGCTHIHIRRVMVEVGIPRRKPGHRLPAPKPSPDERTGHLGCAGQALARTNRPGRRIGTYSLANVPDWAATIVIRYLTDRFLNDEWSIGEIARSVGCPYGHINNLLIELGISRLGSALRPDAAGPTDSVQDGPVASRDGTHTAHEADEVFAQRADTASTALTRTGQITPPPAWVARIVTRYLVDRYLVDLWSIKEIAATVGCSHGHVHNLLVALEIPRRKKARRLRTSDIPTDERIVARYEAGESIGWIAYRTGMSRGYVRDRLLAAQVRMRPGPARRRAAIPDPEIVTRYLAGETIPRLAAAGGVSSVYVGDRLRQAGVPLRRSGPQPLQSQTWHAESTNDRG
ncbi:hypothetical protein O7626_30320 [Micromonospora sp. WMMD1102]|uniref:hypothetical protein n=1 Tax=Micromonospora sp. WMMD1102 TaxID=3016105 RepID=UPI002414EB07|nr:hypothetical protein [Micromonospora sp. WMMD1102]MDG4790167.1 hypothetical protein [Micromonospora sp. WMMD1102]